MSLSYQTYFKNLAAFAARFLKCVWSFRRIEKYYVPFLFDVSRYLYIICSLFKRHFYQKKFYICKVYIYLLWVCDQKLYVFIIKFKLNFSLAQIFSLFLTDVPISYPLRTPENIWFFGVFREYIMAALTKNGLNNTKILLEWWIQR